MSAAKHYLKLAKAAIEKNDPELALEYVEDVLEEDKNNYFAFIFRGKSHQVLDQFAQAATAFERAIEIQPDNLLGWKGYWQVAKSLNDNDLLFKVFGDYLQVQMDQELPVAETLKDFSNYLNNKQYKQDDELYEKYLENIIPGSQINALVGNRFGRSIDNLQKLLDIKLQKQDERVNKVLAKERLRFPKNLNFEQQKELNKLLWPLYESNDLSIYFEEILNVCDDDDERVTYQERYLKYKYDYLKVSPEKTKYLQEVKSMVDDLVLIKIPSLFVWDLYFDLLDIKSFQDLQIDQVVFYIQNFPSESMGSLLYGFINSEISPFDLNEIMKLLGDNEKRTKKSVNDEQDDDEIDAKDLSLLEVVQENDDDDALSSSNLTPEQVLSYMVEGFEKCRKSIFANRIIINYYIQLREYEEASERCRNGIRMLADLQRTIGADLSNSREDIICLLAVVYTYHEAPKNFSKALELYEKILEGNSANKRARIGKGLILMEKGTLETAHELLNQVNNEYPNDADTLMELGWCEVQLKQHQSGRDHLELAIKQLTFHDLQSSELRAKAYWRLAQSYLRSEAYDVNEPYKLLIQSLKEYKNFAASYTSLGLVYLESYDDKARAHKCFYKAFELDVAEVISARHLIEDIAKKREWDVAEILCTKIVHSERSRKALNDNLDPSWPYRVLGCSALNKQDDAKAVEWFQTALRMTSMDFECWIGLGEAYYNCGRLDAAQKVFQRALSINTDSWQVYYLLGKVLCDTKEFDEGLSLLEKALQLSPKEECVINALFQCKLDYIDRLLSNGYFGRVKDLNKEVLDLITQCGAINSKSQSLWISLSNSLQIYLRIQDNLDSFPITELESLFTKVEYAKERDSFMDEINKFHKSLEFSECLDLFSNKKYIECICALNILCFKMCIRVLPDQSRHIRSINYYNLGLSFYGSFNLTENEESRKSSIKCFKKAIQIESKNPQFWVALGNSYATSDPAIAQHCYIKATAIESIDGEIWNNLAALYLKYGDTELAQQAYLRSQSVDPSGSQSWLGHALTAKANNDDAKAANYFKNAYILSNGRSPISQLLFALSVVNKRVTKAEISADNQDVETAQEFGIANFAIQSYLKFYPNDTLGLKIAVTVSERCKTFDLCEQISERLCSNLEAQYEETESEKALQDFVNAKAQLARIYLATNKYDLAIEASQMIIDMVDNEDDVTETNQKNILSARITIGLSYFFKKDLNHSVDQLKIILSDDFQNEWLVTLTAQILNAFGSEATKQAALDQLFTFIEDNETSSSLIIVLTLGAISLKDDLQDILPAVKEELNNLPLVSIVRDSRKHVPKLIEQINKKLGVEQQKLWQRNAILFPQEYNIWRNINDQMALTISGLSETKLTSFDMSKAYLYSNSMRNIQRGLLLAPHNSEAWVSFEAR